MPRFRKKMSTTIFATQYEQGANTGSLPPGVYWSADNRQHCVINDDGYVIPISPGDWIVPGAEDGRYDRVPDYLFRLLYELDE